MSIQMNIKQLFIFDNNIKAYLFLFLLALFMLGANPFKSETVAPMDLLVKYPGWQNTEFVLEPINGQRSDVLDGKLPIWISAKNDLYKGELPIWNHQRGGKPGFTFSNSLITPAFWTFSLVKDNALGFYLSNLVNLLIGLIGMYLFLRLFFGPYASIFGATVFMFSGFNSAWFFWHHVNTAIWTPWVLYAIFKYLDTRLKIYLPLIAFTMFMLNVAGFPMIAVMTYMTIAIMVLLFLISKRFPFKQNLTIIVNLAMFSILALMLAIPFIYPLVELLTWMGDMSSRHGGSGFGLNDFQLFINPYLYRYPQVETTFYVGLLPVLFLFIALALAIRKPKFIALFGLILFLYAITIAFTLISPELIHKVPTLNSSLLTRFGYLIGLSLAIVAAYVVHELSQKVEHKVWGLVLIVLLLSVQIIDQKRLFSSFNGPVPNASFYPETKTINYLQKNMGPFQHVVADRGYLIAGTLGGYGLNDWYAHSFHSVAEKKILNQLVTNAFQTPTSAMFSFSQINLASPYMDYLGIKAILSTSYSIYKHIPVWDNDRSQQPCPNLPKNKLLQPFPIDKDIEINGISLKMATYGDKSASSDVKLILKKEGQIIATSIVDKEKIHDNIWVPFTFGKYIHLTEGNYTLSIKMLDTTNAKALTIWANQKESHYKLQVNDQEVPLSLKMALTQEKQQDAKYKVLNLEPNIYLIKNQHVKNGAYFLKALDTNQTVNYTHITTTIPSNPSIKIDYQGKESGWVVLPMRNYPGWVATVNGKNVEINTFLDMLPAIKVNGKSTILLQYAPNYNKYTYLLALLGLLLLLFSILKFRKKD